MTLLEKILNKEGPLLSSQILRIMELESPGVNPEAIRQRLYRSGLNVRRLFGFFIDNQTFYYLERHYRSDEYYARLRESIQQAAKRIEALVIALEYNNGFFDDKHLATFGISPIGKLLGHKSYGNIVEKMKDLRIITQEDGVYILNSNISLLEESDFKKYKAEETARNFVLSQFMSWARSIGLISYNTGTFYSDFGKFQWCFTSPSYVNGIREYREDKVHPLFVVADVMIGREVREQHVYYFIEKIKILNAQRNLSRFMPFLIVDGIDEKAFKILKENGVIVGFVNKLFGKEYSELLKALIVTVTNAGAILKKEPDKFIDLLSKIDKLVEGKTNNMRGDLFELAVGYYHSRSANIDIGKRILHQEGPKEVDVFAVYPDVVTAAECKGYKKPMTLVEVEEWLLKISVVRKWLLEIEPYKEKHFIAELWSTGGFEEDALVKLREVAGKTKKYEIRFYDQPGILAKFREIKSKKIVDTLKQYYFGEEL